MVGTAGSMADRWATFLKGNAQIETLGSQVVDYMAKIPAEQSACFLAALATYFLARRQEELLTPLAVTLNEAAGTAGIHRWNLILPSSARVSILTYQTVIGVRYHELVKLSDGEYLFGRFLSDLSAKMPQNLTHMLSKTSEWYWGGPCSGCWFLVRFSDLILGCQDNGFIQERGVVAGTRVGVVILVPVFLGALVAVFLVVLVFFSGAILVAIPCLDRGWILAWSFGCLFCCCFGWPFRCCLGRCFALCFCVVGCLAPGLDPCVVVLVPVS